MGEFQYEMVRMQSVQEAEQLLPITFLDRLSAVVPETEVYRAFRAAVDGVEHKVHRFGGEGPVCWVARNIRLVDLQTRSRQTWHLLREDFSEGAGALIETSVVVIKQRSSEHVRARHRKLEDTTRDGSGPLAVRE